MTLKVFEFLNKFGPCRVCDWKMFFDPTFHLKGAFSDFGVHVLPMQKSLKKLKGAHLFFKDQRPPNTALWQGSCLTQI